MAQPAGSPRVRSARSALAAVLVLVATVATSPAQAVELAPADTTANAQGQLAIVVVLAGLAGLVLFGVRRLGTRMLVSRRARRP